MKVNQMNCRVVPLIVVGVLALSASAIETVSPGNADDAATINAAIARAAEGDGKVKLEDGTYLLNAPVVVNAAVELIGNDADRTAVILDAQASSKSSGDWRVIYTMDDGAFVHGMTLQNGRVNDSSGNDPMGLKIDLNCSGGAAFTAGGVFSNCTFKAMRGVFGAVGISRNGVITDCEVRDGYVSAGNGDGYGNGGGVKLAGGILRRTSISGCHAMRGGGVTIAGTGSDALVESCTIFGNWCDDADRGGGVLMRSGRMTNCVIRDNNNGSVSGICLEKGVVENCLIVGNKGGTGGGVKMSNGTLRNCTVIGNEATASAAGVYQTGGAIENCIIWQNGNSPYLRPELSLVRGGGTCVYTCAQQAPEGEGNITDKLPGFVNFAEGDYALTAASPCRGTGKDGVDMGCIPYSAPAEARVSFSYVIVDGAAPASTVFTAALEGEYGAVSGYEWNFGDGSPIDSTSGEMVEHEYTVAGRYTVTLSVKTTNAGTLIYSVPNAVTLGSNEVYVNPKGGKGEFPYASAETACSDIMTAVNAMLVKDGEVGKVHLADGTYDVESTIALKAAIDFIGNDADRSKVVLDGKGKIRLIYTLHPDAFVHGMTIYNGNSQEQADFEGVSYDYSGAAFTAGGVFSNCTFTTMKGIFCAVGISAVGLVTDCEILDSQVTAGNGAGSGNGGGVKIGGGVLRNSLVAGCKANRGGGLRVNDGLVENCVISNCTAQDNTPGYGGGIYQRGGVVSNCVITCNTDKSGRGVYLEKGTMVGCLITGNKGDTAAGVYKVNGTLRNCTVTGNDGKVNGGVVQENGAIENCIIVSNGKLGSDDDSLEVRGGTVTYTCALPKPIGEGNINYDPMFVDAEVGDFRLFGSSPCIDVGLNGDWDAEGFDLAGTKRILVGKPGGTETIDLGCYEYDLSKAPLGCTFDVTSDAESTAIPFAVSFLAHTLGGVDTIKGYVWDFGDGSVVTTETADVSHEYVAFGKYDVVLTLDCTGGAVPPFAKANAVLIRPVEVYVSMTGGDIYPYDTSDKATPDLAAAISAVGVPTGGIGIVHVSPGDYTRAGEDEILLSRAVRVVGEGGAAVTSLSGNRKEAVVMRLTDENAAVEGLTLDGCGVCRLVTVERGTVRNCELKNGNAIEAGGVLMGGGLVEGCLIRDSNSRAYSIANGGFQVKGGILRNCVITNCTSTSQGAGEIQGGTVSNCLIVCNRCLNENQHDRATVMVGSGMLANCVIRGNDSEQSVAGVLVSGGVVRNCLVAENQGNGPAGVKVQNGATVENCTVVRNVSNGLDSGVGIVCDNGAPQVVNTISWENIGPVLNPTDSAVLTTCLFDKDPMFRNPGRGDYRIKNGSPAQNAGTNLDWMQGAVDLFGNARILNKRVDIGCHEKMQSGLILTLW